MKRILLTHGKFAWVDDDNFYRLCEFRWRLFKFRWHAAQVAPGRGKKSGLSFSLNLPSRFDLGGPSVLAAKAPATGSTFLARP